MIIFTHIRYKNFLSTGNVFTEIKLNDVPNALIIGENGAGKSTILDALTFVLFGKPFRKINKPNLVNVINQKNCLVEIEFKANGKLYRVVRGIKPNVFEIWCEGLFINKDSASKDYQEYLEKFILKMGYKSFCQIVILGSASFVPFMQLTPVDRRVIIEDLLDIQVFSVMNNIVKQKLSHNKESLEKNKIEFLGKEDKKSFISKTIETLKQNNEHKKEQLKKEYDDMCLVIEDTKKEVLVLQDQKDVLTEDAEKLDKLRKKHNKFLVMKSKIEANKTKLLGEIEFYDIHSNCPTCKQSIEDNFRNTEKERIQVKINEIDLGLSNISVEIDSCLEEIQRISEIQKQISVLLSKISSKQTLINTMCERQNDILSQITSIDGSDTVLVEHEKELQLVDQEMLLLEEARKQLLEDKKYIETASSLLKDGGIKTKIIKQYLPIINKTINKYLSQMGFFASFTITENFEEVIKARHLEEFSYQNFSEGEKTRIDLAILFTWRSIAKMRNSVNCNLLIFDEIFDGSLDANGTDEFLKIMWNLVGDTNTFVISHKQDQLVDKFKKVYKFEKKKNYSCLC